jgi:carotenoid 1,2-hydratase
MPDLAAPDSSAQSPAATARLAGRSGPGFDHQVPDDGYRWWYVDAFSRDGRCGLTLIAFIGSVFSPYYAAARRRGPASAENFCSLNAIFYGPDRKRWAMTERGRKDLQRSATSLNIGPSSLHWDGSSLLVDIDEITVPFPGRLRGQVRIEVPTLSERCYALDREGMHRWWPACPITRVQVEMAQPHLTWEGTGYFDSNAGSVPLESTFTGWHWCRAATSDGACEVIYDTDPLRGEGRTLALRFAPGDSVTEFPPPPEIALSPTPIWRIARPTRSGGAASVIRTYEDTPFYARSMTRAQLLGEPVVAMHESLDLRRFRRRWVQALLPFRMPRRASRR